MGSTERELVSQETEPFDGREALHTRMRAKWDGVPIAFDIYVMKKDGCIYDFVYMGDPSAFDARRRATSKASCAASARCPAPGRSAGVAG